MSKTKDLYFELVVCEEATNKYFIRANDEDQAQRIFNEHSKYYSEQHSELGKVDKHILEINKVRR